MNIAAFIIPVVLLVIGIEYLLALKSNKKHYFNFDNSISNISAAIAERLIYLFFAAFFYHVFDVIYNRYALFHIPSRWYTWIGLLLLTDLVWYWYHRFGHEVNLLWAAHAVHHQSEDFNFTAGVRITILQSLFRNVFWCILPLVGSNATMVTVILLVHGGYSLLTHTRFIGKLGLLEYIFITPSHHRVHHAINDKYVDKNYGDIFVFWDMLFGTFQVEDEDPQYGLVQPLLHYSFLWQHFHLYFELVNSIEHAKGFRNKVRLLLGPPALIDSKIRPRLERKFLKPQKNLDGSNLFRPYLVFQIAISLIVLFAFTGFFERTDTITKWSVLLFVLVTLVNCSAIIERRRWIHYLEIIRLLLITFYFCYYLNNLPLFSIATITIISIFIASPFKKLYYKTIFN